ncbi:M50 family metallopeptidase [Frigoriglobus tundricola]|uniref:M50 family metallopeptidase n=1 Tax=Frigoriglobus tundricola TaxID=2774151 RepID=UPI00148EB430|nr:M50 family metallopeptidase [Frigoriglobus tundricola]
MLPLFVLMETRNAGVDVIALNLLLVFAVFGCVALHEVGHALAAAAYGIRTRDITLYPIGGIASLERMPEKPLQEVIVTLAGPAVNLVIAGGLLLGLLAADMAFVFTEATEPSFVNVFVAELIFANAVLFLFNLLPCFPMDGGRVLRALLSIRTTRLRATEIAVQVGTVVAVAFLVAGLLIPKTSLIFVAVVVWLLGQAELGGLRIAEARKGIGRRAREVFGGVWVPAAPERTPLPADAAADLAARRFSGLAWDAERRVWVQWVNGVPVRDVAT